MSPTQLSLTTAPGLNPLPNPEGLRLRHTLCGHQGEIYRIVFSPDGKLIASPAADRCIRLWETATGRLKFVLQGHTDRVFSASWSPDSRFLASASRDKTIRVWDTHTGECCRTFTSSDKTIYSLGWSPDGRSLTSASHGNSISTRDATSGELLRRFDGHTGAVYCLAYSPDGTLLASGSTDKTIRIWSCENGNLVRVLTGHAHNVCNVAWSPDGSQIVSGSSDKTIRIWDARSGQQKVMLEGHTQYVTSAYFSADGSLLASKSGDGSVRLWRADTWEMVTTLAEPRNSSGPFLAALAFHPTQAVLATLGEQDTVIRLWDVEPSVLLKNRANMITVHYTNAKVVLVGDSGVGKSGLGLVLSGKPFRETQSTHNRNVSVFDSHRKTLDNGIEETREILLWDLAGQPGYRLIHQLYLNDISVALIVFDARNEVDPFSGIVHWVKALQQAHRARAQQGGPPLKMFLVAARSDRGVVGVGRKRIDALMQQFGFAGYFETSAREGWQIAELARAIRAAVEWDALPKVSSSRLFTNIKDFVIEEKTAGRLVARVDDLYYTFLRTLHGVRNNEELRSQFETCINLLASHGLVERLGFGNLVLLEPERLDSYAAALVNAAKNEPDGLGCIREDAARAGRFQMSATERLQGRDEEWLLYATIENLIRHEIAIRVHADDVAYLVFPSQLTRENADLNNPEGKAAKMSFEGPVIKIYVQLVVRLAYSGLFRLKDLWKNGTLFESMVGSARCGIMLRETSESAAELTLFYGPNAGENHRYQFENFVYQHLKKHSLNGAIKKTYFTVCDKCHYVIPEDVIEARRQRLFDWVHCPVCGHRVAFVKGAAGKVTAQKVNWVKEMDKVADREKEKQVAHSVLAGKKATEDFDVFLCHNSHDKVYIRRISEMLKDRGLLPWLDEDQLRPGFPWQKILEQQIERVKAAAVFVGESGVGPWQDMEQMALLRQFTKRGCPVIPVVLPTCKETPEVPMFLSGMTWVDFRKKKPDPFQQLIWGITGNRGEDFGG